MTDDLAIPAFLRGSRPGPKPRPLRWRMSAAIRPEGEKWEGAERWLCHVDTRLAPALASGSRLLWVVEGRKWVYVRDTEAHQRMPAADWNRMSRTGRKLS